MGELGDIKAIIFDWDDTKVRTFESVHGFWEGFSVTVGIPTPTREDLRKHWGKRLDQVIAGVCNIEDPQLIKEMEAAFWRYNDDIDFCIRPFDFTQRTVLNLKEQGYLLSVVSSGPRKSIETTMNRFLKPIEGSYLMIHSGEDGEVHKPDPRVFDPTLAQLAMRGIKEDQVIYTGDGIGDYLAARNRQIAFAGVLTGLTTREEFRQAGLEDDRILDSLATLPDFLEALK